jgi:hypothetical protein
VGVSNLPSRTNITRESVALIPDPPCTSPVEFASVTELDATDLLARYDEQLRDQVPDPMPEGVRVERDGPVLRFIGWGNGGGVTYRDLGGLEGAELD